MAPGGVGKTQLVKKWQEGLLDSPDHGGVERAFDWSFYSQGTQQQASADDFFDRALRWFGEARPEDYKDPWAKGERLAELVRRRPTLLILDGLEPLQHPPGPMGGELTDPSIQALLEGLQRDNPGLCIVTTREAVRTLDEMSEPKRLTIDLRHLSPEAGADLLERYGVIGDPDELRQASIEVKGHALALILLATYLKQTCRGDIARRPEALLFKGHERYAEHAHKVMASYETWLEREDDVARAAVAILRLMGLFNRPADAGCLAALRAEPPIPGLTDALFVGNQEETWDRAVQRLRDARLLADPDSSTDNLELKTDNSLDAHPLVREHFAAQLTEQFPDAAREAHRRLYEHLKQSAPELPDNLNDMMPLYHAVAHGCKAGLWQQVYDEVYNKRIRQGNSDVQWRKLGVFGADATAVSNFFRKPWTVPEDTLTEWTKGVVVAIAGFNLRALGRLPNTVEPMEVALKLLESQQEWKAGATQASNLSELSLTLGDLRSAVRQGERAVELADRTGDAFSRKTRRARVGSALYAAGKRDVAIAAFHNAEAIQEKSEPQHPILYSISGYQYCDLLLDELSAVSFQPSAEAHVESTLQRIGEVRNRAETALKLAEEFLGKGFGLLDIALDHLTLGRTYLLETRYKRLETRKRRQGTGEELSALDSAEKHLNESVALLRQSGMRDELPRGLLHRAALWRVKYQITNDKSQIELAERDLTEAQRIAERGSMLIWRIEAALERARLALALGHNEQAKAALDQTRDLIRETEKPYVPHKPDWEDWAPPEYIGVFQEGEIVGYHCRNPEIEALQQALDQPPP